MTGALRTPPERFKGLPDYPFPERWFEWEGLRLHYLDEGSGRPIVLFHGEPTWSFLYRRVIPILVAAGYRAIAPDYFGFGKSDKPTDPAAYTYDRHTSSMSALLESLGVEAATAVVQDWGGPIGLRLATETGRFDRLSILNTGLYGGGTISEGFQAWRSFVESSPDLPVRFIMQRSMVRSWPDDVLDAYEAPFPDETYKVGAHRFPLIVPTRPGDAGADDMLRVRTELEQWGAPAQVLFATADPIFSVKVGQRWVDRIPGAHELETIDDAGHFLQEDAGEEVAERIVAFLRKTD